MKLQTNDFEELSMRAIMHARECDRYGMQIKCYLQRELNRQISYGAMYEALSQLEKRGYVESWLEEGGEDRGGQPKRFFKVTGKGEQALRESELAKASPSPLLVPGFAG